MEEHIVKPIVSTIQPTVQQVQQDTSQSVPTEDKQEKPDVQGEKENKWDTILPLDDIYYKLQPLFYKVADYFGLNSRETDLNRNKVIEIMNWGRSESPTKDDADALLRIKDLERKIGVLPGMAEKRHVILYRYIVLASQKSGIKKEMKVWGNYGNR